MKSTISRQEAYARASQRMVGVIARLSPTDAVTVLEALQILVERSLNKTRDELARQ